MVAPRLKQLAAARKAVRIRTLPKSEQSRRQKRVVAQMAHRGLEPDADVRAICPTIAHKLFGKSQAEDLKAGQRRQVRNFAVDVIKALRLAGRI